MIDKIMDIAWPIGAGLILLLVVFFVPNGTASPDLSRSYMLNKAYMAKNSDRYDICRNSVNYGSGTIGDVRLQIRSENFYDDSITVERLDAIEESFMNAVKEQCRDVMQKYESSYEDASKNLEEIKEAETSWWTLLIGSSGRELTNEDLTEYSPAGATMRVSFRDHVFTEQEVKQYFEAQLGL